MTSHVAKRLGVTPQTVRNYAEAGEFPKAVRLPGGDWRIPDSDIDALVARSAAAPAPRLTTQATPADIVTT